MKKRKKRKSTTFDPLGCIPSADAIRRRLAEIREEARRLDILLKVAEKIEQGTQDDGTTNNPTPD